MRAIAIRLRLWNPAFANAGMCGSVPTA